MAALGRQGGIVRARGSIDDSDLPPLDSVGSFATWVERVARATLRGDLSATSARAVGNLLGLWLAVAVGGRAQRRRDDLRRLWMQLPPEALEELRVAPERTGDVLAKHLGERGAEELRRLMGPND